MPGSAFGMGGHHVTGGRERLEEIEANPFVRKRQRHQAVWLDEGGSVLKKSNAIGEVFADVGGDESVEACAHSLRDKRCQRLIPPDKIHRLDAVRRCDAQRGIFCHEVSLCRMIDDCGLPAVRFRYDGIVAWPNESALPWSQGLPA
jgi:hypothetical protein